MREVDGAPMDMKQHAKSFHVNEVVSRLSVEVD
jgi:hypothetical protein